MTRSLHVLTGAALAAVACSAPGLTPSWRSQTEIQADGQRTIVFRPGSPAADYYSAPFRGRAQASPLLSVVLEEARSVCDRERCRVPQVDERLSAAALELAMVQPPDAPLSYALVEFEIHRQGIVEPSPHLLVIWGAPDAPETQENVRARLSSVLASGPFSTIGVGSAEQASGVVTIVAFQRSAVELAPIPRKWKVGAPVTLAGQIAHGHSSPRAFVVGLSGRVRSVPLKVSGRSFEASLSCSKGGQHQVEVTATGPSGATVLANFPIWCGRTPDQELAMAVPRPADAAKTEASAEAELVRLLRNEREKLGLPALRVDPALSKIARAHSEDMESENFVAHVSPRSGTAADRVQRAKFRTLSVFENVARAYGVNEAHQGLMNSPGHRANILSTDATHVGIGVVFGDKVAGQNQLYVTQLFAKVPQKVPLATARLRAFRAAKASGLRPDPDLEFVADGFAHAVAAGMPVPRASERWGEQLTQRVGSRLGRVNTVITSALDMESFKVPEARAKEYSFFGVGVALGRHPELGDEVYTIVLLLGAP